MWQARIYCRQCNISMWDILAQKSLLEQTLEIIIIIIFLTCIQLTSMKRGLKTAG